MKPSIEIITPNNSVLVSVSDLKLHLRLNTNNEDGQLADFIRAAKEMFERMTNGRIILATTFKEYFPSWSYLQFPTERLQPPSRFSLTLQKGKVSSITAVNYYDSNNNLQTISSYTADLTGQHAIVTIPPSTSVPALSRDVIRPISVQYVAGWATANDVPAIIRSAILGLAAHYYRVRESHSEVEYKDVTMGFSTVVDHYKMIATV